MLWNRRKRSRHPPFLLKQRSSKWFISSLICWATFMDGLMYSSIIPIIPFSLVDVSGVRPSDVQFWISILLVVHGAAFTISSLFAGWLTDKTTLRRTPFFAGLIVLFISTAVFLVAYNPILLMVARILQGSASAIVYTAGLAILVDTVGQGHMGAWMGFALSGMGIGILVGPALGGFVYANAGYHALFWTIMGVIALTFIWTVVIVEKKSAVKYMASSDNKGEGYGTFPDRSKTKDQRFILGLDDDDDDDDDDDAGLSENDNAASSSSLLARDYEETSRNTAHGPQTPQSGPKGSPDSTMNTSRGPSRLFPVLTKLLRSSRLITAIYGSFIYVSLFSGCESTLPNYLHKAFNWDSSITGSVFLAISIPHLLTPVTGALSDRFGVRKVVLMGFTLASTSLALLALITQSDVGHVVFLICLLLLLGFGITAMFVPLAADMFVAVSHMSEVDEKTFGPNGAFAQAYGLFNACQGLGGMFGSAFAGAVFAKGGWTAVTLALAGFCATGSIPMMLFTGSRRKADIEQEQSNA